MTEDIIGVQHDYVSDILEKATQRLSEKGVRLVRTEVQTPSLAPSKAIYQGIGNKHMASLELPTLETKPSEQEETELIQEWVEDVESQMRRGGAK